MQNRFVDVCDLLREILSTNCNPQGSGSRQTESKKLLWERSNPRTDVGSPFLSLGTFWPLSAMLVINLWSWSREFAQIVYFSFGLQVWGIWGKKSLIDTAAQASLSMLTFPGHIWHIRAGADQSSELLSAQAGQCIGSWWFALSCSICRITDYIWEEHIRQVFVCTAVVFVCVCVCVVCACVCVRRIRWLVIDLNKCSSCPAN